MALDPELIVALDERAQQVGWQIGWDLRFITAPNPEYVGVTAAAIDKNDDSVNHLLVVGPRAISDGAVDDIRLTLDQLASGMRHIVLDEDGDPRLI
ncbi:hypothetical protein [Pedococcus bigeumensis]|uniref:Uncharacterized protein n=1 Tax=Pedococcus bigeumensis TaxID=433644 RepID=A0A502CYC1_9MICO|nr:hypothetical protein [Pedococcus bigeumensis]TPG17159.1 hypothetical protein EAH86_10370 [Pedococcus bigeumensis]